MAFEHSLELTYWCHENLEVDFILSQENRHVAIEVKSGRKRDALNGMKRFAAQFNPQRSLMEIFFRSLVAIRDLFSYFSVSSTAFICGYRALSFGEASAVALRAVAGQAVLQHTRDQPTPHSSMSL